MSESFRRQLVTTGTLAAVEALPFITAITQKAHRQETHESLELGPVAEFAGSTILWFSGNHPDVWADTHSPHHKLEDTNLVWIMKVGDMLDWRQEHPEVTYPSIPVSFPNLDPEADLTPEGIQRITVAARGMRTRRGEAIRDLYTRPETYSEAELLELADNTTVRYRYKTKPSLLARLLRREQAAAPTEPAADSVESIAHHLLDAHSPALDELGVAGIALHNVARYRASAKKFEVERKLHNDYDQSTAYKRFYVTHKNWGLPAFFAANIAGRLVRSVLKKELTPKQAVINALSGSAAAGGALLGLIIGGNVTNSGGHAGDIHPWQRLRKLDLKGLWSDFTKQPPMKADGTYTTDAGVLGILTQDEVGRQRQHHLYPWKIAYTTEKGWQKIKEAPYGSFVEFLARHNIGMRPGKAFGERDEPGGFDHSKRPDMPAEAVLLLQAARRHTLEKKARQAPIA